MKNEGMTFQRQFTLGDMSLTLSAPDPLPVPYAGDDLRTALFEIHFNHFTIPICMTREQLSMLSMATREALVWMDGRGKK